MGLFTVFSAVCLIYDEAMIKEAFADTQHGVLVGGKAVNSVR